MIIMDDNERSDDNHRNNTMYYNQMVCDSKVGVRSFGSKKIHFSDIVFAPKGYESVFYIVYFLTIPYIVGIVFLFLFIAGATLENFMLLKVDSFFIVWAIGYEVIATVSLAYITYLYFRYLSEDSKKKKVKKSIRY